MSSSLERNRPNAPRRTRPIALATLAFAFALSLFLTNLAGAGDNAATRLAAAPPQNTSSPKIVGSALEGQILQGTGGKWRHVKLIRYAYQWQRCGATSVSCEAVPNATDSIYTLRSEDVGRTLRLVVTATNPSGSGSALSRRTAVVASAPANTPVNIVKPTITGNPLKGNALAAQAGTWSGGAPTRTRYTWRRCNDSGGSCKALEQTGQTYLLGSADVGHTLRVLVTEENSIGKGSALSLPTTVIGPVTTPPPAAPKNTSRPTIAGTTRQGQTLTASSGSWSGTAPIRFAFAWQRCTPSGGSCATIRGASQQTYTLGAADVRRTLRVLVTATNPAGSSAAVSQPSSLVAGPSASTKPSNQTEPSISGTAQVGRVLTTSSGSWAGTEPITYTYRWRRCNGSGRSDASDCALISNANGSTYAVRDADVGFHLRVQVTASNRAGSASVASNPTVAVTYGKPTNTAPPTISGTAATGNILHADRGRWVGKQPITYGYQWLRCDRLSGANCTLIPSATGSDYRVASADVGKSLRVRVSARNAGGSQSVVSPLRNVIGGSPPPPPPPGSSVPVGDLKAAGDRLVISSVQFSPNPVRSRTAPITVRVRVTARGGRPVSGALVFMRGTPRTVSGQTQATQADGWVTLTLVPNQYFPQPRNGFNQQFFIKAYRAGDPPLGGIAGYRLVQVPLAG